MTTVTPISYYIIKLNWCVNSVNNHISANNFKKVSELKSKYVRIVELKEKK